MRRRHLVTTTVAAGIAAGFLIPLHPWLNPNSTSSVPVVVETRGTAVAPRVEEDSPLWNCLTMGNGICGPSYVKVSQSLGDALAEGDDAAFSDRVWEDCKTNTHVVVCPWGQVVQVDRN